MLRRRRLALAILLLSLPLSVRSLTALPAQAGRAEVDPRVLADTEGGRAAHFLVLLNVRADARHAGAGAPNVHAAGDRAIAALRAAAAASQPALRAMLDGRGVAYRPYWIVNALAVEGDRSVVEALAARPEVRSIEPDRAIRGVTASPERDLEAPDSVGWNIARIGAPSLWSLGYTGTGTIYANADTGVQWDHPALRPHYLGWNGSAADHNYHWWDAIHADIDGMPNPCGYNTLAPCDDYGHGTHTLGTGIGDDGAGNQIGVAPGARWIACRNMDGGVGRPSTYVECLQFFAAPTDLNGQNPDTSLRPDVVGNSYDCPLGPPPSGETCTVTSLKEAVDNMRALGVFMAVSAGNDGPACDSVGSPPGLYDSAITIGAVNGSNQIADFSGRGPVTTDSSGRRKPDLVAPGVGVRSSTVGGGYGLMNGTSMAAPHAAGAAALLWSALPGLRQDAHRVDQTEALLEQTALHLTSGQCGDGPAVSPNNVYGYGLIDVFAAYQAARAAAAPTPRTFLPAVNR
jgi:subtilisin family serine protease